MPPQPCKVPLKTYTLFGLRVTTHEGIYNQLKRIEHAWLARGGQAAYRVHTLYGYNCRMTRSGRRWSDHAYGWAVDINPQQNPYSKTFQTDMPVWFVNLFKAEGFGWGGDWQSVFDTMHFSKNPNEGGDGKLEGSATDVPEDDMLTKDEHDALARIDADTDVLDGMNKRLARIELSLQEAVKAGSQVTAAQIAGELLKQMEANDG